MMNAAINALLEESKAWLASQPDAVPQTAYWYALGNFTSFVGGIEADPSAHGIERAVHALRYHINDQFEWSEPYCKAITEFCNRADRVRKQALHG